MDIKSLENQTVWYMFHANWTKNKEVNPHVPSGPVHPFQMGESISSFRGVWCTVSFLFYF